MFACLPRFRVSFASVLIRCPLDFHFQVSIYIVTPPAHSAFRELATEQARLEMIPSARGMAYPYKVGYAIRLRRILERVAVAVLRANDVQIGTYLRDCVSSVATGAAAGG